MKTRASLFCSVLLLPVAHVAAQTAVNQPGTLSFTNPLIWSAGVPTSSTDALINQPTTTTVNLNGSGNVANLTIGSADVLNVNLGSSLYIYGASIANGGALNLFGGAGNNTFLNIAADTALTGPGRLTLNDAGGGGNAYIYASGANHTLTNSSTLQGSGIIGNGTGLTLANSGTVNANQSGQTLVMNGTGGVSNTGTLQASNGGTLQLGNTIAVANAGGNIAASGVGSTVNIYNSTINGGTLTATSGGVIQSQGNAYLNGVTLNGNYLSDLGANTYLTGTTINNGNIQLNGGAGNNGIVQITGNTTLQGGTVTLNFEGGGGNAYIQQAGGNFTLTNGGTLQGSGIVGNGGLSLINNGTVNANQNGQTLVLNGSNTSNGGALANNGTLEASNGATLQLGNSITVNNAGQSIQASGAGSTVSIYNSTINGGTLTATGGGILQTQSSAYLNGVTINGNYLSDLGTSTYLTGTTTHSGMIQVNGGSGINTYLQIAANTTLQGGTVTLNTTGGGGSAFIQQSGGNFTLTNNETIQGSGTIGNGGLALINNGTINSSQSGRTLVLNGSNTNNGGVLANNGTLEASNGATLQLGNSITVANAGQLIAASGAGSAVTIFNSTINGGTLNASGGGLLQTLSTATLNGVTINGNYLSDLSTYTYLTGTTTNNGNVQLNGGSGTNTYLQIAGNTTLQGTGAVTLNFEGGGGNVFVQQSGGTFTLTNNETIQGSGIIGNGGLTLVNGATGTLLANSVGNALLINGSGGLTNGGTLQANAGSTLHVTSSLANFSGNTLAGGTYALYGTPLATATLQLNSLGTTGGEIVNNAANILLNGPNARTLFVDANGLNALSNLAANSTGGSSLSVANGYNFTTAGGFSNAGTVHAATGGTFTASNGITGPTGTVQIDSGGTVSLAGGSTSSSTGTLTQNGTLALGSHNVTVSSSYTNANFGSGNSFDNHANVTGSGQILAAGNAALALSGSAVSGGTTTAPALADFGNVHVGHSVTLYYAIGNSGSTGPSLQGAIQTSVNGGNITDSRLSGTGVTASNFAPLNPGQSTSQYAVTFTGSTAGVLAAGQTIHFASNFDNVPSPTLTLGGGSAYNLASSNTIAPISVVAHVGDGGGSVGQTLTITNTAPAGAFSEGLDSSFGGFTAGPGNTLTPTLSGSITNLAAGLTDNSSMRVAIGTTTAGVFNGTVTVDQASNGAGTSGLGIAPLPSQQVAASGSVTAGVFNYATPTINTPQPIDFGNVRVSGTVANQTISISNTAPVSQYTEFLNGSVVSAPAPFTASGSFSGLAAGAPANTSISVGMNTGSAGHQSGNVVLGFVSDGTSIANDGTSTPLQNQNVQLQGNVYQAAKAALLPTTVDLGTVRSGTLINTGLAISNVAPLTGGYTETLGASFGAVSSGLLGTGSLTSLGAGAPASSALSVQYIAAAAGAYSGSASVNFNTEAINGSGLGILGISSQAVNFSGTVNALANANLLHTGPYSFTPTGLYSGMIDFGMVTAGSGSLLTTFELLNNVNGPADLLTGTFDTSALAGSMFGFGGNSAFSLGAQQSSAFHLTFNTDVATGFFTANLYFNEASSNAYQSDLPLGRYDLTIQGTINPSGSKTPDGGSTCLLLGASLVGLLLVRRSTCGQSKAVAARCSCV